MANLNRPGLSLNGFGPASLDSPLSVTRGLLLYAPFLQDARAFSFPTGQMVNPSSISVDADGTYRSWGGQQIVQTTLNTPRVEPGLGILVEDAQSNFLTRSSDITHADWVNIGTPTHTGSAIEVPDGTTSGQPLGDDDAGAIEGEKQLFVGTAKPWCLSAYFKKKTASGNFPGLRLHKAAVTTGGAIFNLDTGEVIAETANPPDSQGIEYCGNGWYRCWVTDTLTAVADWEAHVYGAIADAFDGGTDVAAVGDVYVWGMMLEKDIVPSSYIPTVAAAVTRSRDVIQFDNTAEVHLKGAQGTVLLAFTSEWTGNGIDNAYLFDSRKAGNEGVAMFHPKNAETLKLVCENDAGVEQANFTGACPHVRGETHILCGLWDTNNFNLFRDGASIGTDVAGTPDTSGTIIGIGSRYNDADPAKGGIRHVTIYDRALSVAEVQAVTRDIQRMVE